MEHGLSKCESHQARARSMSTLGRKIGFHPLSVRAGKVAQVLQPTPLLEAQQNLPLT
jgi:hypothetical protein